ncbi:adenylyltransferase/cytidyltransferase family protein [Desulfogranum marinum]|uniref:adenylyltransferase/cytidyltransferase family protein n=1 Tax=Desulfogranum marinum TaxID=453220 RepID=UPI0019664509|nr:adenylyltransferase/cytidyltransferase family protein [Desulfogranum marinum]MBM9513272.1 adenylyltransferase/cytidyltransferase family protein [Desulfogranum marinum]
MNSVSETIIITFGTFDLFHIGHLRILERAAALGDKLYVGVSSDALNYGKKKAYPTYNQQDRMEIVQAIRCVDMVFLEESLEEKREYLLQHNGSVLVMGDDWKGKFDEFSDIVEVVYLTRTALISTSAAKKRIVDEAQKIYDPAFPCSSSL